MMCVITGEFPQGCTVFRTISPNVESEESGMRDDSGMQDVAYTEVSIEYLYFHYATGVENKFLNEQKSQIAVNVVFYIFIFVLNVCTKIC